MGADIIYIHHIVTLSLAYDISCMVKIGNNVLLVFYNNISF